MDIFNSYVKLPEGSSTLPDLLTIKKVGNSHRHVKLPECNRQCLWTSALLVAISWFHVRLVRWIEVPLAATGHFPRSFAETFDPLLGNQRKTCISPAGLERAEIGRHFSKMWAANGCKTFEVSFWPISTQFIMALHLPTSIAHQMMGLRFRSYSTFLLIRSPVSCGKVCWLCKMCLVDCPVLFAGSSCRFHPPGSSRQPVRCSPIVSKHGFPPWKWLWGTIFPSILRQSQKKNIVPVMSHDISTWIFPSKPSHIYIVHILYNPIWLVTISLLHPQHTSVAGRLHWQQHSTGVGETFRTKNGPWD